MAKDTIKDKLKHYKLATRETRKAKDKYAKERAKRNEARILSDLLFGE